MTNKKKSLGEAELQIMQVIWSAKEPVSSNYVLKQLQDRRKWQLSTLMTSLNRMVEKEFLTCDKSTGKNLYSAIVTENDYKAQESQNFLSKLYNNSVQNLITTLYSNKMMKDVDIDELRKFLDELEEKENE